MESFRSADQISFPAEESLMTPEERRLRALEAERKERSSRGQQETIAQQREYETSVRENLISDLRDLKDILKQETASSSMAGQVCIVEALVASGHLPKEALAGHPIMVGETTRGLAMKRLASLNESNDRLAMLDVAFCLPDDECAKLKGVRDAELHAIEGEWGLN